MEAHYMGVGWHGYLHPMQVISTNSMSHETRIPEWLKEQYMKLCMSTVNHQSQSFSAISLNTKDQKYSDILIRIYYKHTYEKHHATIACTIELICKFSPNFRGFTKINTSNIFPKETHRKPSDPNLLQEPKVTQVTNKHVTMPGALAVNTVGLKTSYKWSDINPIS